MKTDNRTFLIIIAIILVGIFLALVIEKNRTSPGNKISDSLSDVMDSANDGVKEFREEVKDEIDDHTDATP